MTDPPHARDLLPTLIERRRRAGRVRVALGLGGALSPIVGRPSDEDAFAVVRELTHAG